MMKKLLLAALICVSMASVNAGTTLPPLNDKDISVTSMGLEDNAMVFNLKYDNEQGEKLVIRIVDQDGTNLYKDILSDKNISRTFKIPADLGSVVLLVSTVNGKNQQKFEISAERRFVDNVMITNIH